MRDGFNELDYYCCLYLLHGGVIPNRNRLVARGQVSGSPLAFFRGHYKIPNELTIDIGSSNLQAGGVIRTIKFGDHYSIDLASSHLGWVAAEDAIVAHELAHVFMDINGLALDNVAKNERLTDTCVALLGGGLVANFVSYENSYASDTPGYIRVATGRLGYLSPAERAYVMARFFLFCGYSKPPNLGEYGIRQSDLKPIRDIWDIAMKRLAKVATKPQKNNGTWICPRCESIMVDDKNTISCKICGVAGTMGFWSGWKAIMF